LTLIVGLGNPGTKYQNNRHNVGFMVIDRLIGDHNYTSISKSSFKGELFKSQDILFLKPTTYMNLCGESVRAVCDYYKPQKVIVIHDDLDLHFGTLRFKFSGGTGGHNGLKSIDSHIGQEYYRVRIGIGNPESKQDVAAYVLSDFPKASSENLEAILGQSLRATQELMSQDLNKVASMYSLRGNFENGTKS
jgi:PTH1 family peptidyl-tRNA hydrolase